MCFVLFEQVVCVFLVVLAVASAQLIYGPAYAARGAYGAHNPFAISSAARVDAPRRDLIGYGALPLAYI